MDNAKWNEAIRALDAKNYGLARELFQCFGDNKDAQLQLGFLYQEGLGGERDLDKAQEIYHNLASAGDSKGMYFLGKLFLNTGQLLESLRYLEQSAQSHHVSGAFWAAELHHGLHGHPIDEKKYRFFIKQAADLGHIYAMRNVALDNMRDAKTFFIWIKALWGYVTATIKGAAKAIRNPHDQHIT